MRNITTKLNCIAELWGMVTYIDDLKEHNQKEDKIKDFICCNILPVSARLGATVKNNSDVTEISEYSHKFIVRIKSIIDIDISMFFIYKNQKYKFKSWIPDYKDNEFLEVFTELIVE